MYHHIDDHIHSLPMFFFALRLNSKLITRSNVPVSHITGKFWVCSSSVRSLHVRPGFLASSVFWFFSMMIGHRVYQTAVNWEGRCGWCISRAAMQLWAPACCPATHLNKHIPTDKWEWKGQIQAQTWLKNTIQIPHQYKWSNKSSNMKHKDL